jgi:hypothetical protein
MPHNLPNSNETSTGFHAVVETPEGISYVADRPVLIITNALGRKAGADRADPPCPVRANVSTFDHGCRNAAE